MMSYVGITFNEKHSWRDYGLKPVKFNTPLPVQRKITQEVPGMHGSLDLSESLTGYVLYENRPLEFIFDLRAHSQEEFETKIFAIRNDLDGMKCNMILDTDSGYYYVGRVAVSGNYNQEEIEHEIVITADAYPFKYKIHKTVVNRTIVKEDTIILQNDRMEVIPEIKVSAECRVIFNGTSYALSAGTSIQPDMILKRGENTLRLIGNTDVEITYQEGAL